MFIVTLYGKETILPKTEFTVGADVGEVEDFLDERIIDAGEKHGMTVNFDGQLYDCPLRSDHSAYYIGNLHYCYSNGEDTGEPFVIYFAYDGTFLIAEDGNHTISVYVNSETEIHGASEKLKSGKVVKGINSIDSFSFSMLMSNVGFNLVHDFTTLVKVYNTNRNRYEFFGRVLYSDTTMSETGLITKDVTCESYLGFLCDSQQPVVGVKNWTVRGLLQHIIDKHNEQLADEPYKHFTIGEVTVTDPNDNLYLGIQYANSWETLKEKLLDKLGGELRLRVENGVNYLDYLTKIGSTSTTEIRLSHNMKSIKQEKDPSAYITRLIPLGMKMGENDERLTVAEANGGKDYIDDVEGIERYGLHIGYHEWDDVTEASNLLKKGEAWLKENNRLKIKYSITALDLSLLGLDIDDFDVCNSHPLKNALLGIDDVARIVKKSIDVCEEIKSTIEVGDNFKTLSDIQVSQAQETKKVYSKITKTDEEIRLYVADEIKGVNSTISATADAINMEIHGEDGTGGLAGQVAALSLSLDSIKLEVRGEDGEGGLAGKVSSIEQTLENITLEVSNGDTSSTIRLMSGSTEIDSAEIKLTGVVTFNALSGSPGTGQTTINGGWLKGEVLEGNTIMGGKFYDIDGVAVLDLSVEHNDVSVPGLTFSTVKVNSNGDETLDKNIFYIWPVVEDASSVGFALAGCPCILAEVDEDNEYLGHFTAYGDWLFGNATIDFGGQSADDLGITFDVPEPDLSDITVSEITDGTANLYIAIVNSGRAFVANRSITPETGDEWIGLASHYWKGGLFEELYVDGEGVTSDRNKKHDIFYDLSGYDALFDQLRPVGYKLNSGTSGRVHIGMIAQDVEETVSLCGMTGQDFGAVVRLVEEDGAEHYYLRYMEFIGLLIDQVQKLKARVARLEEA